MVSRLAQVDGEQLLPPSLPGTTEPARRAAASGRREDGRCGDGRHTPSQRAKATSQTQRPDRQTSKQANKREASPPPVSSSRRAPVGHDTWEYRYMAPLPTERTMVLRLALQNTMAVRHYPRPTWVFVRGGAGRRGGETQELASWSRLGLLAFFFRLALMACLEVSTGRRSSLHHPTQAKQRCRLDCGTRHMAHTHTRTHEPGRTRAQRTHTTWDRHTPPYSRPSPLT